MNCFPSGKATWATGSGSKYFKPYLLISPSSSLSNSGLERIKVWPVEQVSMRKPGSSSSSVAAPPPGIERASSNKVLKPAFAK